MAKQNQNMSSGIQSVPNLLSLVGNTPLVELKKIVDGFKGNFYAKWEAYNPGHSNKDRIALHIIEEAERQGLIKENTTIIETTSGNANPIA